MAVFENCTVVLDVKNVPYKEKNKLRLALLDNGGNISYVINKEVRITQITWGPLCFIMLIVPQEIKMMMKCAMFVVKSCSVSSDLLLSSLVLFCSH